jgi:hypothetical protein
MTALVEIAHWVLILISHDEVVPGLAHEILRSRASESYFGIMRNAGVAVG